MKAYRANSCLRVKVPRIAISECGTYIKHEVQGITAEMKSGKPKTISEIDSPVELILDPAWIPIAHSSPELE